MRLDHGGGAGGGRTEGYVAHRRGPGRLPHRGLPPGNRSRRRDLPRRSTRPSDRPGRGGPARGRPGRPSHRDVVLLRLPPGDCRTSVHGGFAGFPGRGEGPGRARYWRTVALSPGLRREHHATGRPEHGGRLQGRERPYRGNAGRRGRQDLRGHPHPPEARGARAHGIAVPHFRLALGAGHRRGLYPPGRQGRNPLTRIHRPAAARRGAGHQGGMPRGAG